MSPAMTVSVYLVIIILGFFLAFEQSRPQARDLVIVAQVSALCICVRLIFSFVPYFNPVMAVIFLSGVSLGVRKGFVTGALTALVSNFLLGQGPWTLYQMVSWGFVGVIAGIVVKCHLISSCRWKAADYAAACLVAFCTVVFVTGPLMDLSSYFLYGIDIKLALAGGFAMNAILAVSTVVTIAVFSQPFLKAVERGKRIRN